MTFTTQELKRIEELAALFLTPSEIALDLDVPAEKFKFELSMSDSDASKAYRRGKLGQKIEVRRQMALLARVGSPSALEMSERALLDMEDDE